MPERQLTASVNGTVIDQRVFRLVGFKEHSDFIRIPREVIDGAQAFTIDFNFDKKMSPAEAGIGGDPREFGYFIRSLSLSDSPGRVAAETPKAYYAGDVISFGTESSLNASLFYGLSGAGDHGRWSDSQRVGIRIPLQDANTYPVGLNITGIPFVANAQPELTLQASINGVHVITRTFTEYKMQSFKVDIPKTATHNDYIELIIEFDKIVSPKEIGEGPDERRLGFMFHSIELVP